MRLAADNRKRRPRRRRGGPVAIRYDAADASADEQRCRCLSETMAVVA